MIKTGLWVEDYQPTTVEDLILPKTTKKQFRNFVKNGEFTSLIFEGNPGTGKTSSAKALCNDLECDSIIINCSEDSGIDVLRTRIREFSSTVSFMSEAKHKVVILDEADYLNPTSVQPALRGFIEEFQKNVRFIFTCNYANKILPALHSRCPPLKFNIPVDEKPALSFKFFKRVCSILEENNIEYDTKVVVKFINHHFPDMRRTLNDLQLYAASGQIDVGILSLIDNSTFIELIGFLKEKNFKACRSWIETVSDDPIAIYNKLYETAYTYVEPTSIPILIEIIADYSYKTAFVANHKITLAAAFVNIMSEVNFK